MTKENVPFVNDVRSDFFGDWQIIKRKEDTENSDMFIMKKWTTQKDRQTKSVVSSKCHSPQKKMELHAVSFIFVIIMCIFNGSCMLKN